MKVILDCNVIISAGLNNGACRKTLEIVVQNHECFISDEIEREYLEVIEKPRFKTRKKDFLALIGLIVSFSERVESGKSAFRLSDPDDEIYITAAIAANADAIITGNKRHFPQDAYGAVRILSPAQFLEITKPQVRTRK